MPYVKKGQAQSSVLDSPIAFRHNVVVYLTQGITPRASKGHSI
jgi:hypothetical protein